MKTYHGKIHTSRKDPSYTNFFTWNIHFSFLNLNTSQSSEDSHCMVTIQGTKNTHPSRKYYKFARHLEKIKTSTHCIALISISKDILPPSHRSSHYAATSFAFFSSCPVSGKVPRCVRGYFCS